MKKTTGLKTLIAIVGMILFFGGYIFASSPSRIEIIEEKLNQSREVRSIMRIEVEKLQEAIDERVEKIKYEEKYSDCLKESRDDKELDCDNIGDGDSKESLHTEKTERVSRAEILMERVCEKGSPMCNDWDMFNSAQKIFEDRGVPFGIALGIMFAESTLGKNYAGTCNASWNNWGGIKWAKYDDGSTSKNTENHQVIPNNWIDKNSNGKADTGETCWMYKFDSMDDYFQSKANTLGIGYKACFSRSQPIRCISYAYVGNANVAEESWIKNVASIAY